jgi:tetratricopeptide (TPR) repeat protein
MILTKESRSLEKLIKDAQKAYKKKDFLVAASAYQSAASIYAATGDDLAAAEMLNNSSVAFLQAGELELALNSTKGTEVTFAESNDPRRQAIALGNQAAALEAMGKLEESVTLYETSADLLKQCGDLESYTVVQQSLSGVQLRLGRHLEALASMQVGLDSIERPTAKQKLVKKILRTPLDYFGRSS